MWQPIAHQINMSCIVSGHLILFADAKDTRLTCSFRHTVVKRQNLHSFGVIMVNG